MRLGTSRSPTGAGRARAAAALALAALLHAGLAGAQGAAEPAPGEAQGASEAERKDQARQTFMKGVAALKEGAPGAALPEFLRSRALYPTKNATLNAILCLRKLDRLDEELEMLEALLREFASLTPDEKKEAQRRVAELRGVLGTIAVDGAEIGAAIVIDGRNRADFPAVAPLYVARGSHIVRVYKEGFEPFETRIDVAGGQTVRVTAKLRGLLASGRLRVAVRGGGVLSVLVDGVSVGETPWEGPLSVGAHVVVLRGSEDIGTQPALAVVKSQQTTLLTLEAGTLDASLLVQATPAGAAIAVDSVEVARGIWDGRLRSGPHRVEVAADGFVAERRELTLEPGREVVKIELARDPDAPLWRKPSKIVIEAGAALGIAPMLGGDVAGTCQGECSAPPGLGALASAYGGYELGSGIGFGVTAGYLFAQRSVEGRAAKLKPLGLPALDGSADDDFLFTGLLLGAAASLRTGDRLPLLVRLGVGGLFGRIGDARRARVQLGGGLFEAPELVDSRTVNHLYFAPEVRLGLRVIEGVEVSAGLSALVLIAFSTPRWGDEQPRPVLLPAQGYSTYPAESLADPLSLVLAPGLSARYDF